MYSFCSDKPSKQTMHSLNKNSAIAEMAAQIELLLLSAGTCI